jgi:hypothetical protein
LAPVCAFASKPAKKTTPQKMKVPVKNWRNEKGDVIMIPSLGSKVQRST